MARLMLTRTEIGRTIPARSSALQRERDQTAAIEEQLEALQSMDLIALRGEWRKLKGQEPPRFSRDLMLRALAHAIQIEVFGDLRAGTIKKRAPPDSTTDGTSQGKEVRPQRLSAGARLVREWHGKTHSVEVLQEGFLFEGKIYRSLSEITRRITGSHWSGPRFFGLVKKRK
jgi:hypothetical protein